MGKSTLIDMLCDALEVYIHPYEGWSDSFSDTVDLVVMDDYHGEIKVSELNRFVDGSRTKLPRRNRTPLLKVVNTPVIVCANQDISGTYPNADRVRVEALQTRFIEIPLERGESNQFISQIKINKPETQ